MLCICGSNLATNFHALLVLSQIDLKHPVSIQNFRLQDHRKKIVFKVQNKQKLFLNNSPSDPSDIVQSKHKLTRYYINSYFNVKFKSSNNRKPFTAISHDTILISSRFNNKYGVKRLCLSVCQLDVELLSPRWNNAKSRVIICEMLLTTHCTVDTETNKHLWRYQ